MCPYIVSYSFLYINNIIFVQKTQQNIKLVKKRVYKTLNTRYLNWCKENFTKGGGRMKENDIRFKFDYSKLRGRIREIYGTQDKYAEKLHMGKVSLSQRLNGKLEFSQHEIMASCDILGIPTSEIPVYFFTVK